MGANGYGRGGSSIPVPSYAERMMRHVAMEVTPKIPGVRCVYNSRHKTLGFYYRSPHDGFMAGPIALQVFRQNGEYVDLTHKVGHVVRTLQLGRIPRKLKDAMAKAEQEKMEMAEKAERDRDINARLDQSCEMLRHKRRGRKSLVIDGGKS